MHVFYVTVYTNVRTEYHRILEPSGETATATYRSCLYVPTYQYTRSSTCCILWTDTALRTNR